MWLRQARAGRFEVKIDTSDLEPRLDELGGIARMLTLGLVLFGVLIASAIAANAPHTAGLRWVRDTGLIAYAVALVLAAILIVELFRRRTRRKRNPRRVQARR
jgi:hypothetical protein